MRLRRIFLPLYRFCLIVAMVALFTGTAVRGDATQTVTRTNLGDWTIWDDATRNDWGFTVGPETPPLGAGSAVMDVGGRGGMWFVNQSDNEFLLADVTRLEISAYIVQPNDWQDWYYVFKDIGPAEDNPIGLISTLLRFEPEDGSVMLNVWQEWDLLAGRWSFYNPRFRDGFSRDTSNLCSVESPCTWAEVLALLPNAKTTDGISIAAGSNVADDFLGYFDAVVFGVNGEDTTYDFEPLPGAIVIRKQVRGGENEQVFTLCVDGDAIDRPRCDTITGGEARRLPTRTLLIDDLPAGTYTVYELYPGDRWEVSGGGEVVLGEGGYVEVTLTNVLRDYAPLTIVPFCPAGTFNVTNPNDYPVSFTWDVEGTDVSGEGTIEDASVLIETGLTSGTLRVYFEGELNDSAEHRSDCDPQTAQVHITKVVHWHGSPIDQSTQFWLCIDSEQQAEPRCEAVGPMGGTVTFTGLPPGMYTTYERDPGPLWQASGGGGTFLVVAGGNYWTDIFNGRVGYIPLEFDWTCPAGSFAVTNPNTYAVPYTWTTNTGDSGGGTLAPGATDAVQTTSPDGTVELFVYGEFQRRYALSSHEDCGNSVTSEPNLTCPSGYVMLWARNGTLALPPHPSANTEDVFTFSTGVPYNLAITAAIGAGHPEAGCAAGSDNDGYEPCDQGQNSEHYNIFVDHAVSVYMPDPGEDTWSLRLPSVVGLMAPGEHTVRIAHAGSDSGTPESVFYKVMLCGEPQGPEPTAIPTEEPEPTAIPTEEPEPTAIPTEEPEPTAIPTEEPEPTVAPTEPPPFPAPTLTCPADYEAIGEWHGLLGLGPHAGANPDDSYPFSLTTWSQVQIIAAAGAGHPDRGCLPGGGNDAGRYPCDQGQTLESYGIRIDGASVAVIGDPGEDTWGVNGPLDGGVLAASSHTLQLVHAGGTTGTNSESVFYRVLLCGQPVPPPTSSMTLTKTVVWGDIPVDEAQTFEMCLAGENLDGWWCQTVGAHGGTVTFDGLEPGEYATREVDPGLDWFVTGGRTFTVPAEDGVNIEITNTRRGTIVVNKTVDWGDTPVDEDQTFTICVTGYFINHPTNEPLCQTVGATGGTLTFPHIPIGGLHTVYEVDPGDGWAAPVPIGLNLHAGQTTTVDMDNVREVTYVPLTALAVCPAGTIEITNPNPYLVSYFWESSLDSPYHGSAPIPANSTSTLVVTPGAHVLIARRGADGGASIELDALLPEDCESSNGSIVVLKRVGWNDHPVDETQTFDVCVDGAAIEHGPRCQTIGAEGGTLTFGDLPPGDYSVYEVDPGRDWLPPSPVIVTLSEGQSVMLQLHNWHITAANHRLDVDVIVAWGEAPVDPAQTFELCLASDLYEGLQYCQTVGANGGTITFADLPPGQYSVREGRDPGAAWLPRTLYDTYRAIPWPYPPSLSVVYLRSGTIVVNKTVDWNGVPVDESQTFDLCIERNGNTPTCASVGAQGGTVVFEHLRTGTYTVYEQGAGPQWNSTGPQQVNMSEHGQTITVDMHNVREAPPTGGIAVNVAVDWQGIPEDPYTEVRVCVVRTGDGAQTCQDRPGPGELMFSELEPGAYQVNASMSGGILYFYYLWDPNPQATAVTVEAGQTANAAFTFNRLATGTIRVTKTVDWNGQPPDPDMTFTICLAMDGEIITRPYCRTVTDGGVAEFGGLPPYTYEVIEETPMPGYSPPAPQMVVVGAGETVDITLMNTRIGPEPEITEQPESGD